MSRRGLQSPGNHRSTRQACGRISIPYLEFQYWERGREIPEPARGPEFSYLFPRHRASVRTPDILTLIFWTGQRIAYTSNLLSNSIKAVGIAQRRGHCSKADSFIYTTQYGYYGRCPRDIHSSPCSYRPYVEASLRHILGQSSARGYRCGECPPLCFQKSRNPEQHTSTTGARQSKAKCTDSEAQGLCGTKCQER